MKLNEINGLNGVGGLDGLKSIILQHSFRGNYLQIEGAHLELCLQPLQCVITCHLENAFANLGITEDVAREKSS